jgi:hypothetical protein
VDLVASGVAGHVHELSHEQFADALSPPIARHGDLVDLRLAPSSRWSRA